MNPNTPATQTFRVAPVSESLRRSFVDPTFDDSDWAEVPVPGHWQATQAFANHDGPMLYRSQLGDPPAAPSPGQDGIRHWLVVGGVHNAADVWFNTAYLGHTDGYFVPHQFEVTDHIASAEPGRPHHLGIEAMSRSAREPGSRANTLTGIFDNAEVVGPTWNAGGIVRPITLATSGPVRQWGVRLVNVDTSSTRATIRAGATMLSEIAREVTVRTTVTTPGGVQLEPDLSTHHLSSGETQIEWTFGVTEPELWWPRALGSQPLYTIEIAVLCDKGLVSDVETRTMGMRSVHLDDWQLRINGERFFVKGAVHWPTQRALANAPAAQVEGDVDRAIDLGLDLLRVHTHVARPELYEAADRKGLLLWQDMPLSGRANRNLVARARRDAGHMVTQLAHHPSVVIWCGHDDPTGTTRRPDQKKSTFRTVWSAVRQEAPSWNKSVLDRAISSSIERLDPSRPIIPHSGAWPSPPVLDGTDTHLWFGWATGTGRDLADFARTVPRMVRWVGAFGAQSFPANAPFVDRALWPDLQWSNLQGKHGLDRRAMAEFIPTAPFDEYEAWARATQEYQATLLRRQIEFLRSLKYTPTGGFSFTALADCRPAVSFAILDDQRNPKRAYEAVKAACAPVIVVADRLPSDITPGAPISLGVHVISELRHALPTHNLQAVLTWPGGSREWNWQGQIGADDVARIGTLEWTATAQPGPVVLSLTLRRPDDGTVLASNTYQAMITLPISP